MLHQAAGELGLQGVRFHGLLDDDVGVVVAKRTYNFTNVDAIWDVIRAAVRSQRCPQRAALARACPRRHRLTLAVRRSRSPQRML